MSKTIKMYNDNLIESGLISYESLLKEFIFFIEFNDKYNKKNIDISINDIKFYCDEFNISDRNSKGIPYSFNLPAIYTCKNCSSCSSKCYARKAFLQYLATRVMYWRNWNYTKRTSLKKFVSDFKSWAISKNDLEFFRIHSSGDFYNQTYLNKWVAVIKDNPNVKFWAYTKNFDLNFDEVKKLKNFTLIISAFEEMETKHIKRVIELSKDFPISEAGDIKIPNIKKRIECNMNCDECNFKCFELKKGHCVEFKIH